ncbi:MAG: efflux RND transporter periplasmic adaptor subunit [Victivallaceae bacterium]|nr:efflux RND transporter periplasmic adaptor subunit [Victivallaceae bacterium]
MKAKLFKIVLLLAVLVGAVCAWMFRENIIGYFRGGETELVLYGNVDDREVNLVYVVPEIVKKVLVEEGAVVKKGDLLGELETIRIENSVKSAKASAESAKSAVDAARAIYDKVKTGPRAEELAMARAEVAAIQAKLPAVESDYKRQEVLRNTKAVSAQIAENAESAYLLLKAQLENANQNLKMLEAGSRKEDIAAAAAQLAQTEAQLAQAQAQYDIELQALADTKLYAPRDGIIRSRILEPGEMATNQTTALVMAVMSPKWIRVYMPEPLLMKVKMGDKAKIYFDSMPDKPFDGWVGYISPTAEFTPKNVETPELRTALVYEFRVYVNDPDNLLKLGAPATVVFPGVMVPRQ